MPQETNFNVSPYFDDFDKNKDYYKVLFKPGYPVQARELTTLQSMLQNQMEQFGKHVFKEGSVVIPGQLKYNNPIYGVEIDPNFNGLPISLYIDSLLNQKVRGSVSGVSAQIFLILPDNESERGNYTLYVKYLESGGIDFANKRFQDGETLVLENTITYGQNYVIQSGQGVCSTISTNCNSSGSSVSVANGVYFIRGIFANVNEQTILLDQYGTNPSYKVGFDIIEKIVTADEDESLYDNARNYSNYTAPGADRFQLSLTLSKKSLDDIEVDNFVEILRVENGIPSFFDKNPTYNLIRDELARRTFDESGNYFVKPFDIFIRDSLNDRVLTNGIYFDNQVTVNGNTPKEESMVYQINPGKAYVNGYEVETISNRFLDVPKARTLKTIDKELISYNAGSLLVLNNTYGAPVIGIGTDAVLSLLDSRLGDDSSVAAGTTIGVARIYDFVPETNFEYNNSPGSGAEYQKRSFIRLFDIQTYTKLIFATNITVTASTHIEGRKSGATGFVKFDVNSNNTVILYEVSGRFIQNESIIINGIENGRTILNVVDYSVNDIKSVYSPNTIGITSFCSDVILDTKTYLEKPGTNYIITKIDITEGISTVTSGLNNVFTNKLKPGDIISYSLPEYDAAPFYNKVVSVSAAGTSFTIEPVKSNYGFNVGYLPYIDVTVNDIVKITPTIYSKDSSLLTKLNKDNIQSFSLENSQITQRRSFRVNFSGYRIRVDIDPLDKDIYFDSFDEDKFVITYSDGKKEDIRFDKYEIDTTGKTIFFNDLSEESGTADVIATVVNLKPNSKVKDLNRVKTLVVPYSKYTSSGIGNTTLNDGLNYSKVYGTRVQDKIISLNVPDVIRVLAVYESNGTSEPNLPKIQLVSFTGQSATNSDFIVGEQIIGKTSGAVGLITKLIDSDKIEYVHLNTAYFSSSEVIEGKDSKIQGTLVNILESDKNITQNFTFDNGQRSTIYDYSRIIRKPGVKEPTKSLKIVYQYYSIKSSDTGEFITVNSYPSASFKHDVPLFDNARVTDYIDIRPRVAPYTYESTQKSPFEFDSRRFDSDGQYSKYILVPGENILTSYSYYVGRIDKIFLNSDGTFEVSQGIPADKPLSPSSKSNALDIAEIYIPPYVYDINNVSVVLNEHKRYRMQDIALLEDRIERVEKFTTLSMLESKTENFTIRDAETGLDRFKCGFFVDNFSTHDYHDLTNSSFRAAIDTSTNTLRPSHYTTSLDLQLGSEVISGFGQTYIPDKDHNYVDDLGSPGIRKTGDLITLNYENVLYYEQPYATKVESVTPFLVKYWTGSIQLNPPIDHWIEERLIIERFESISRKLLNPIPDINITLVNNVINNQVVYTNPTTIQTGIPSFDWITNARSILSTITSLGGVRVNSSGVGSGLGQRLAQSTIIGGNTIHLEVWKSNVTNADKNLIRQLLPSDVAQSYITQIGTNDGQNRVLIDFTPTNQATRTTSRTSTTTASTSNTRTLIIPPEINTTVTTTESKSNYTEPVVYLRSRNIEFDVKGLRPVTKFFPYFATIDVSNYIIPKLLEIQMISGKFEIGETIESDPHFTTNKIKFRLCSPNHKEGPYNNPSQTFRLIPYTQTTPPSKYTESSTYLNIDTKSLQLPSEVDYYGSISLNMTLIGKSSGAVAKINNIRLVSDSSGRLIGSLFIPDPKNVGNPRWINGHNAFTVIDVPSLSQLNATDENTVSESSAEADFTSSAIANVKDTKILTTRSTVITPARNINITNITNTTTNTTTVSQTTSGSGTNQVSIWETHDPLAQSFYVKEDTGIFLTAVDVFFQTVDDSIPVTLQIRPMIAGVPSNLVIPFSEVTLTPDQITTSIDGSVSTQFVFPSPVYLNGPQQLEVRQSPVGSQQTSEYAIVLLSNSPNYRVFVSELGQLDILTKIRIGQQPTLGSLFKSQNGSTWTPSQLEDLKYRIYRADFVNEGIVRFFNPKLSLKNKKITVTGENQLLPLSKKAVVGLSTDIAYTQNFVPGVTLSQYGSNVNAKLVGIAGSVTVGTGVTITNVGFGYTDGVFNNVSLISETGYGKNVIADITVVSNKIDTVSITNGGYGYQIGDSLLIPNIGQDVGYGGKVSVKTLSISNSLVVDNITDGLFNLNTTEVNYTNSVGFTTWISPGAKINSIDYDPYYDGVHMKINHVNHGMHSPSNFVRVSHVRPTEEEPHTKLSTTLSSTEISKISVSDATGFDLFENIPISPSNPGYVVIGQEVVGYTSITYSPNGDTLKDLTRGLDFTEIQNYSENTPIYRYQFNGISLRRINKDHIIEESDTSTHPIDLNHYYIKINQDSVDFEGRVIGDARNDILFFENTKQMGKAGGLLSNNIQYEAITPNISYILPSKTNIDSRMRSFTGTSVSGDELSFVDSGYSDIHLNETTFFANPQLICSSVNEERLITGSPGNRSLTMEFIMKTDDSRVSPVIDLIRTSVILTTNLVNAPAGIEKSSTYQDVEFVRSLEGDSHAAIYISKPVSLKLPANSLKVLLTGSRNDMNDIRVLYRLFREDSSEVSSNYELFPGYSNYFTDGNGIRRVKDASKNDGSADSYANQSSDRSFKDYEYSVDDLPDFTGFAIKIIMASENQATPPLIKQLRAIATIKPKV